MSFLPIDRIEKNIILLTRNTPVCLLVGAAGFIGSNLTDELLKKTVQVVGIDNLSTGRRENLTEAGKHKNFHFIHQSITSGLGLGSVSLQSLELPRLDYSFFVVDFDNQNELLDRGLNNFLAFVLRHKGLKDRRKDSPKLVFLSSINVYDREEEENLAQLKNAEITFAKFTKENDLNSRIVRLAAVYGPRMHFRYSDPMVRLIQAQLKGELQKEHLALDFSTRAIFIEDAISLIIKSVFSGGTANKIFDGSLMHPIKVSEIKQVLLDPMWYESRGFEPEQLPPWTTPNLERTVKELPWSPKKKLIPSLKETITYFKEHEGEIEVPELTKSSVFDKSPWKNKSLKDPMEREVEKEDKTESHKKGVFSSWLLFLVIAFGIIFPIGSLAYEIYSFKNDLAGVENSLRKGDFKIALKKVNSMEQTINLLKGMGQLTLVLKRINILSSEINSIEAVLDSALDGINGVRLGIEGGEVLLSGARYISNEEKGTPLPDYNQAQLKLTSAIEKINLAKVTLAENREDSNNKTFLKYFKDNLSSRLTSYSNLMEKAKVASILLPEITAVNGKKSYLVLFQNNLELRPTGGVIEEISKIDFEKGRLINISVEDSSTLDKNLKEVIEVPTELKADLKLEKLLLRDSNYDPDFPTSARQAQFIYSREGGDRGINGVFALDLYSVKKLLNAVSGVNLGDLGEVNEKNLFDKFLKGDDTFFVAFYKELLNKVFFLPKQNWPAVVHSLSEGLEQKHTLIFLAQPQLLSVIASLNWAGIMPREANDTNALPRDFLSIIEANVGENKSNFYLDRSLDLETFIKQDGSVNHQLKINLSNNSPSDSSVSGKYKDRLRIYLPSGTKLTRANLGEKDKLADFSSYSDFGRSVYSTVFEVFPGEKTSLNLEYILSKPISFNASKGVYQLDIRKQPGTGDDGINWRIRIPNNLKFDSIDSSAKVNPQEVKVSSDLSTDRAFKVEFSR